MSARPFRRWRELCGPKLFAGQSASTRFDSRYSCAVRASLAGSTRSTIGLTKPRQTSGSAWVANRWVASAFSSIARGPRHRLDEVARLRRSRPRSDFGFPASCCPDAGEVPVRSGHREVGEEISAADQIENDVAPGAAGGDGFSPSCKAMALDAAVSRNDERAYFCLERCLFALSNLRQSDVLPRVQVPPGKADQGEQRSRRFRAKRPALAGS